jgi:hypothetical protein
MFTVSTLLLAALSSCTPAAPPLPGEEHAGASPSPAASCPTHKLGFSKETGCRNDGSVEFCLKTGDEALLTRVKEIAPTIVAGASRGRAGCNVPAETLYFFPTREDECAAPHGALGDAAWDRVCRIAALPEVRSIVPTWYE